MSPIAPIQPTVKRFFTTMYPNGGSVVAPQARRYVQQQGPPYNIFEANKCQYEVLRSVKDFDLESKSDQYAAV